MVDTLASRPSAGASRCTVGLTRIGDTGWHDALLETSTALAHAGQQGHADTAKLLLEARGDAIKARDAEIALRAAAVRGQLDVVRHLAAGLVQLLSAGPGFVLRKMKRQVFSARGMT